MLVYAILVMIAAGLVLGFILGFAADKLVVIQDPLVTTITDLLPGYNCGGCGYPGCEKFAQGLINQEVSKISLCRPSKPEEREIIKQTFEKTPNLDGDIISVNI